jgi:hypothetical protein
MIDLFDSETNPILTQFDKQISLDIENKVELIELEWEDNLDSELFKESNKDQLHMRWKLLWKIYRDEFKKRLHFKT